MMCRVNSYNKEKLDFTTSMPSPSPMRAVARKRGQAFAYYNKLSLPHAVDEHAAVDSIL
jgi:hypothetical protein